MARRVWPFTVFAVPLLMLAGCSEWGGAQRAAWRGAAERACFAAHLIRISSYIEPERPINGPGACGLSRPLRVTALLGGRVTFNGHYILDCSMVAALNRWLRGVVEPAAQARFGEPVVELISLGSYNCRTIDHMPGERLSEHAFGNAIDISGFRLYDGRVISVRRDWNYGDAAAKAFLRDVEGGACSDFTTVLGPGADRFHFNHFHLDLAMHGNTSTGPRRYCRPAPRHSPPHSPPDGLPNPPPLDEELDIAQAGSAGAAYTPPQALHGPGGGGLAAAVPPAPPASVGTYRPVKYGTLRSDGAFVPEGKPSDWDLPSTARR